MLLAYIQIITWIQHRKLKAGVSNDTDIGKFIKNDMFDDSFNELELRAWKQLFDLVKNFLSNHQD